MKHILTFLRREDGPTAVEYSVMLALIIGAVFTTVGLIGSRTASSYSNSSNSITSFMNGS